MQNYHNGLETHTGYVSKAGASERAQNALFDLRLANDVLTGLLNNPRPDSAVWIEQVVRHIMRLHKIITKGA